MRVSSARVTSSSSGAGIDAFSQFEKQIVRDVGITRPQPNERVQQFDHLFARKLGEPPAATLVCELLYSVFAQLEQACLEGRFRRPRWINLPRVPPPRFGGSP